MQFNFKVQRNLAVFTTKQVLEDTSDPFKDVKTKAW